MILAAHQPQFAPWMGYFDKMAHADVFVILDTVQFKKNEWQNRNRIKGANGPQWLTVPVSFSSKDPISEVRVCNKTDWPRRHVASLRASYGKSPYFREVLAWYEPFVNRGWESLSELNLTLIEVLKRALDVTTPLIPSSSLALAEDDRDARLIELCHSLGADTYLAGAGGRDYMELTRYRDAGIEVVFQEFEHPIYPQRFGDFEPALSVLDLLSNCGPDARDVLAGRPKTQQEEAHERSRDRLPSR